MWLMILQDAAVKPCSCRTPWLHLAEALKNLVHEIFDSDCTPIGWEAALHQTWLLPVLIYSSLAHCMLLVEEVFSYFGSLWGCKLLADLLS